MNEIKRQFNLVLIESIIDNDFEKVKRAIESGANTKKVVSPYNKTDYKYVIQHAVIHCGPEICELIHNTGISLNVVTKNNDNLLHIAASDSGYLYDHAYSSILEKPDEHLIKAEKENYRLIEYLLEKKVNPGAKNINGFSPLDIVSQSARVKNLMMRYT